MALSSSRAWTVTWRYARNTTFQESVLDSGGLPEPPLSSTRLVAIRRALTMALRAKRHCPGPAPGQAAIAFNILQSVILSL